MLSVIFGSNERVDRVRNSKDCKSITLTGVECRSTTRECAKEDAEGQAIDFLFYLLSILEPLWF